MLAAIASEAVPAYAIRLVLLLRRHDRGVLCPPLQGDHAWAMELLQRAIDIQTEALGPDAPEVAASWYKYAALLRDKSQAEDDAAMATMDRCGSLLA